jgi:hypothetical protein
MRTRLLLFAAVSLSIAVMTVKAQSVVVVADPTLASEQTEVKLSAADQAVFDKALIPVKSKIAADTCEASPEVAGVAHGAFSQAAAKQTLIFYQYCQTGNGLGWVGLVLAENGKVIGNYITDSGWTIDIGTVPDVNQNGLDEFTLHYGGGMHQGQGGVGVDLMEFSKGVPKGIGWFQAEKFEDTEAVTVWKVTAKSAPTPIFYKQKFASAGDSKWRRVGGNLLFKLGKPYGAFTVVK